MLFEIISKYWLFVISLFLSALVFTGCDLSWMHERVPANKKPLTTTADFGDPVLAGYIESNEITESSGLVYSLCNKGVLWTHNDSGNENYIYALDLKGKSLGRWKVTGATNRDWEDIATYRDESGKCFLYMGDIGNNGLVKTTLTIYKIPEPKVVDNAGTGNTTEPAKALSFSYPGKSYNSEALMIHPKTGDFYVVTKTRNGAAFVFRIDTGKKTAVKVGEINLPSIPSGFVTGGDIAQDGKSLIICDYFGGYIFTLPENAKNFDEIWKQKPAVVDLGNRSQGEAVAFSENGEEIYATSEKSPSPLFLVKQKK